MERTNRWQRAGQDKPTDRRRQQVIGLLSLLCFTAQANAMEAVRGVKPLGRIAGHTLRSTSKGMPPTYGRALSVLKGKGFSAPVMMPSSALLKGYRPFMTRAFHSSVSICSKETQHWATESDKTEGSSSPDAIEMRAEKVVQKLEREIVNQMYQDDPKSKESVDPADPYTWDFKLLQQVSKDHLEKLAEEMLYGSNNINLDLAEKVCELLHSKFMNYKISKQPYVAAFFAELQNRIKLDKPREESPFSEWLNFFATAHWRLWSAYGVGIEQLLARMTPQDPTFKKVFDSETYYRLLKVAFKAGEQLEYNCATVVNKKLFKSYFADVGDYLQFQASMPIYLFEKDLANGKGTPDDPYVVTYDPDDIYTEERLSLTESCCEEELDAMNEADLSAEEKDAIMSGMKRASIAQNFIQILRFTHTLNR